ncbi:MAG: LysM peptidoglycan-binding domain-containing protein [Anaerolinea sp.]|nr:LysM peptidoglycan-binding domain-containing protein [Anaerolinea sp.]MCC6976166.1 LysM peptidoglycan-binding domain-containing protein [Anaerolineae bacterium]
MRKNFTLRLRSVIVLALVLGVAFSGVTSIRAQGGTGFYVVQPGDTLFSIADKMGVSLSELATINGLYDVNRVFVGQVLTLPVAIRAPQAPVVQPPAPVYVTPVNVFPPGTTVTTVTSYLGYTVRAGDNLSKIAERYKTTMQLIMGANGIVDPNLIYVGQRLVIPRTRTTVSPAPRAQRPVGRVYIVQPGDNLFGIAARFRRDVYAIAKANQLLNLNYIYVGQALIIP